MFIHRKIQTTLMGIALSGLVVGCATDIKRAHIDKGETPQVILKEVANAHSKAYTVRADLLAPEDFTEGQKYFKEAQMEQAADRIEMDEFRSAAGYSIAYFERAYMEAKDRAGEYKEVLDARQSAITAGAMNYETIRQKMKEADKKFKELVEENQNYVNKTDIAAFQKRYLDLEVMAVQENEISTAERMIEDAESTKAGVLAPKHLAQAKKDVLEARNLIAKSPRDSQVYEGAVYKAYDSSLMLTDVVRVIETREQQIPESVAAEIVRKDQQLMERQDRVAELRSRLQVTQAAAGALGEALTDTEKSLIEKDQKLAMQKRIEQLSSQVSKEEAEVYRQGNDIIFRLKQIPFPVGKATIPEKSKPLLKKVSEIISEMDAEKVLIVGHTDVTGPKDFNKELAKDRARQVANYMSEYSKTNFEIDGKGASQPLAVNSTAKGRQLNRRVDIVVKTDKL